MDAGYAAAMEFEWFFFRFCLGLSVSAGSCTSESYTTLWVKFNWHLHLASRMLSAVLVGE